MKKTVTSSKHGKLSLKLETVRLLTSEDLTLVVGGACKLASVKTQIVPPPGEGMAANQQVAPPPRPPTC